MKMGWFLERSGCIRILPVLFSGGQRLTIVHVSRDKRYADDAVPLIKAHNPDAFCAAPDDPDLVNPDPDYNTGCGHHNNLIAR
jgi:hypothetical protein